jgi:hypothetical protein
MESKMDAAVGDFFIHKTFTETRSVVGFILTEPATLGMLSGEIVVGRPGWTSRSNWDLVCENKWAVDLDFFSHSGEIVSPSDDRRFYPDAYWDCSRRGARWVPNDATIDKVRYWRTAKRKAYLLDLAREECEIWSGQKDMFTLRAEYMHNDCGNVYGAWIGSSFLELEEAKNELKDFVVNFHAALLHTVQPPLFQR